MSRSSPPASPSRPSRSTRGDRPRSAASDAPRDRDAGRGRERPADRHALLLCLALAAAAFLVYANALRSPFVFDDLSRLVRNPLLEQWPPWAAIAGSSRPLAQLTFALNYRISGFQPWSWHLVNVAIHAAAGVVLFALVRRTLARSPVATRYRQSAGALAFAAALLWTVHPLATEAVTYVVQRSESLASLFYLLTLWALARAANAKAPARWQALAVVACACGVASKPMAATAPLAALLYDRTFLAGSFRAALAARGRMYGGLFATLLLLPFLLAAAPSDWRYSSVAGAGIGALDYAKTQPGVILHYLRLALWPVGLTIDYAWPVARGVAEVVVPLLAVAALLAGSIALLARGNVVGFLGAFFFLVLAPTSSVIPILDLAFEHRMYLALAAVMVAAALGGYELVTAIGRRAGGGAAERRAALGGLAAAALVLGAATVARNADYGSAIALWSDAAAQRPRNPRPGVNLAYALAERDGDARGFAVVDSVVRLHPDYPWGHLAAGYFLVKLGRPQEALPRLREAARRLPESGEARYLLGSTLLELGAFEQAIPELEQALRLEPWRVEAENNLGAAHLRRGAFDAAIPHFERAVALRPRYANARFNLAIAYGSRGDVGRARAELETLLALDPGYEPARRVLAAHDEELRQSQGANADTAGRRAAGAPR